MKPEEAHLLKEGDLWRAEIELKDKTWQENIVIVVEFMERFGCSQGLAFNSYGCSQLIHPRRIKLIKQIPDEEFLSLKNELHEQGKRLFNYIEDLYNKKDTTD